MTSNPQVVEEPTSQNVFTRVTQEIISRLEKGTIPWHQPWKNGPEGSPLNLVSGKRYRGINVFLLGMRPYHTRYWLTFRQAVSLGGHVRKGEKSAPVFFWKWPEKDQHISNKEKSTEKEQSRTIPIARCYHVFNVEQCEGVEYPRAETTPKPGWHPVESAEKIAVGYPNAPKIEHRGDRAFYLSIQDAICLPPKDSFESVPEYYCALFHEMVHSTGLEKRLARKSLTDLCPFGSTNYSNEELVAEMGAAMLCGEAGIENRIIDNSAGYIAGWLKRLKDDRRCIVTAASQAQRAADWILGNTSER